MDDESKETSTLDNSGLLLLLVACSRLIGYGKSVGIYGISRAVQLRLTVSGVFACSIVRGEISRIKTTRREPWLAAVVEVCDRLRFYAELKSCFLRASGLIKTTRKSEETRRLYHRVVYICVSQTVRNIAMTHAGRVNEMSFPSATKERVSRTRR